MLSERTQAIDDFHKAKLRAGQAILAACETTDIQALHQKLKQLLNVMSTAQPLMVKEPSK